MYVALLCASSNESLILFKLFVRNPNVWWAISLHVQFQYSSKLENWCQASQLIYWQYQIRSLLRIWSSSSWNDIIGFLQRIDRHIFIVIDELHLVYQTSFPRGENFIGELLLLDCESKGRFHCIITGSGSDLRKLVTAKMTLLDARKRSLPATTAQIWMQQSFNPWQFCPW
jgi:hypothetical protein